MSVCVCVCVLEGRVGSRGAEGAYYYSNPGVLNIPLTL